MDYCAALPAGSGFIGSTTGFIDCQAQLLGEGAWQALAAPGSTLAIVLTAFLAIAIALIGYRLLLGFSFSVREATLWFVKIGIVFALATSWPAYRTLVYDLVTDGPAQLVAQIGPRAALPGSDGTLVQRLDLADRGLAQLAVLGPGNATLGPADDASTPPPPFAGFDAFALGGSRILFLLTALASLGVVRIVSALALALGPFFIAFVMFDATRSLFDGWVRVLAGAGLAAIGVSIGLGLELGLIEPWLSAVLAHRMAGDSMPNMPTELFVLSCLFTLIVVGCLMASARMACTFRLPLSRLMMAPRDRTPVNTGPLRQSDEERVTLIRTEAERAQATVVSGILAAVARRDAHIDGASLRVHPTFSQPSSAPVLDTARHPPPLGHSFSRRVHGRTSFLAVKRDNQK